MRKWIALFAWIACVGGSSSALAQIGGPGDLGIFLDENATTPGSLGGTHVPFVFYDVYVIAIDPPGGQLGFEFAMDADPRTTLTEETLFPPEATDVGTDSGNFKNYLVDTGGVCLQGQVQVLVHWKWLMFTDTDDILFCLDAGFPSSLVPTRPAWFPCDQPGVPRPFGAAYEGCAIANCVVDFLCTVPVEASTWGALKGAYR